MLCFVAVLRRQKLTEQQGDRIRVIFGTYFQTGLTPSPEQIQRKIRNESLLKEVVVTKIRNWIRYRIEKYVLKSRFLMKCRKLYE